MNMHEYLFHKSGGTTISEDMGWFLMILDGWWWGWTVQQMNYTTHGRIMTTFKIAIRTLLSVYKHNTITYNALEQMSWAWAIPTATLLLHEYALIFICALAKVDEPTWVLDLAMLIHIYSPPSCCMHYIVTWSKMLLAWPGHFKQQF